MSEQGSGDITEQDGGGFLSRWSRRKRQAAMSDEQPPVVPVTAEPEAEAEPEPPPLTDADMPPIDSLDEGSDYSGFMSPGVSDELRQLALRKLFRSAGFNVRDGLDDYDDDFTSFAKLGDIVTREMRVRQAIDAAREKAKAALAEAGADAPELADEHQQPAQAVAGDDAPRAIADPDAPAQGTSLEEQPDEQPKQPA